MTESAGNNRRTIIIVVVVAVILLCCCCPAVGYGIYWLWNNGDQLLEGISRVLPVALQML